jgi:predicted transposase/invertase (TIGR01784 family)
MKAKYINPYTDFGFKKLFGEEASKTSLVDFLTSLLPELTITELNFKDKNQSGKSETDRKAVYDIYCENHLGEKIIVELQKAKQNYFKDRTIYYSTFPIQEQAEKGEWDFRLKAVYCVGILDFVFEPQAEKEVIHTVQLKDQKNRLFYDKLQYVYIEMPNFTKELWELETRLDKWLYFIKHLEDIQDIPEIFKDSIFLAAFSTAEIAKYSTEERNDYEQSLKIFRDNKNTMDTAYFEGKMEGRLEGKMEGRLEGEFVGIGIGEERKLKEVRKNGKAMGLTISQLSMLTGLSELLLEQYLNEMEN